MNANDIANVRNDRKIFLSLGVYDYGSENRGKIIRTSLMMQRVIYDFQSANIFALSSSVRKAGIDDNTEEVIVVILSIKIGILE
jgi:hypothetical protein